METALAAVGAVDLDAGKWVALTVFSLRAQTVVYVDVAEVGEVGLDYRIADAVVLGRVAERMACLGWHEDGR